MGHYISRKVTAISKEGPHFLKQILLFIKYFTLYYFLLEYSLNNSFALFISCFYELLKLFYSSVVSMCRMCLVS